MTPSEPSSHPETFNQAVNTPDFWQAIYREQDSPRWNLGMAAPPLAHWITQTLPKPGRVLVPGCGYGHDARLFAERGFETLAVDFAPLAIERARAKHADAPATLRWHCGDIFELPRDSSFDYAYEYTCIVAIHPSRWPEYARLIFDTLKPGGMLVGCFYNHGRPGGPPFNVTREQVLAVYGPLFEIRKLEVSPHSIDRRQGHELWAEFVKPA